MNRTIQRITLLAGLSSAVFACSEPSSPVASSPVSGPQPVTVLAARSPSSFSSRVGSDVAASNIPTVIVQDTTGKPVSGVVVTFSIDGGGGSIRSRDATSNSLGVAQALNWKLGTKAGVNAMTAFAKTGGSASFQAVGLPDKPYYMEKIAGDSQLGYAGAETAVKPSVVVMDQYENAIPGVPVTFSIGAGGGSITGAEVATDASGVATLGAWKLGLSGEQSLVASSSILTLTFSATAIPQFPGCESTLLLTVGTAASGVLGAGDCQTSDGKHFQAYLVNLKEAATVFTLNSPAFDAYLEVRGAALLASTINKKGVVGRGIKTILPAGIYTVLVSSLNSNPAGAYTLSAVATTALVSGCEEAYIARGTNSYQATTSSDCVVGQSTQADRFRIYLQKGSALLVQMDDLSYSEHGLTLTNAGGETVAQAVTQNYYTYYLSFSAPADGFYTINATNSDNDYAEYTLTIR